jgi:hypothetical protein
MKTVTFKKTLGVGLLLVLSVSSITSASFLIAIGGVVDPVGAVNMLPSDTMTFSMMGVGNDNSTTWMYLLVQGPAVTSGGVSLYGGTMDEVRTQTRAQWEAEWEYPGVFDEYGFKGVTSATSICLATTVTPAPALNGKLVDLISYHAEGFGTVTLTLVADDLMTVYDTQVIQQIPEPATLLLLGLGAFMFRKRK